jgi:hypothetical protein
MPRSKSQQPVLSIEPGEVVRRGRPIQVSHRTQLSAESVRGIVVVGQAPTVTLDEGARSVTVDTATLPLGRHQLRVDELGENRSGAKLDDVAVDFVVVDSSAPVPDELSVHHAVRLVIGDLDVARLAMDGKAEAGSIDVFKAVHRKDGSPVQVAYDSRGREVDVDRELGALTERRWERYGKLHPAVHERLREGGQIEVMVWLAVPDLGPVEKSTRGETRRPPAVEAKQREVFSEMAERFASEAGQHELKVVRVDDLAPVVVASMPASQVRAMAESDLVAGVFLHETEGVEDLSDSIAIARSGLAHTAGFTGSGIRVAVYEDGPDVTTNLDIEDRYTSSPALSDHARHTHGIIKNIESGAPHGHAPDCDLYSANSMDLDAIRWAARDRGCTVISQSFHRPDEQTTSTLSGDDVYKDWLAVTWPYPTICEAAGNGAASEFVNHKGYNRVTVGNHNDTASAMASDSVFTNPATSHGDRELPEIAANGVSVTAVGLTKGGTSMAAPAVAGATAVIQQANGTLRSWPEGCRAILMAGANRNPAGSTWRADLVAGVDGRDGAGALDTKAALDIARSRTSAGTRGRSRGWDVGTSRAAETNPSGFSTSSWFVTVPRLLFFPKVKVALAWDSKVTSLELPFFTIRTDALTVDLDLHVFDEAGNQVASSASWDNSYEIAEFGAARGATYEIRIRRWSGTDDTWFGLAWTVTGFNLFEEIVSLQRLQLAGLGG